MTCMDGVLGGGRGRNGKGYIPRTYYVFLILIQKDYGVLGSFPSLSYHSVLRQKGWCKTEWIMSRALKYTISFLPMRL